ncbi:MAG: trigger factor, partial [Erysipelotrichaceae bacterium]|nr:trigger factor [Erysipelotrichaceae bacterium]
QEGDRVTIDFVGKKDGVAFEGGSGDNYPLELGSNTFIPGFEEQLIGVKAGEQKEVNVTFPKDYQAKDLAGQDAVFEVNVHEISYKERPEANDELIKKLKREGVETLEQFKEVTKEDLKKQKQNQAEEEFNNAILDSITKSSEVEIPEVMIQNEVNRMYNDFARRMEGSGFTLKQYFEAVGQSEEDLKSTFVPEATDKVKASLVLDAIVKEENIEVSDKDIEKEYEEMSKMYQMEVDQIRRILPAENLKYDIAQQKALELIKSSVK